MVGAPVDPRKAIKRPLKTINTIIRPPWHTHTHSVGPHRSPITFCRPPMASSGPPKVSNRPPKAINGLPNNINGPPQPQRCFFCFCFFLLFGPGPCFLGKPNAFFCFLEPDFRAFAESTFWKPCSSRGLHKPLVGLHKSPIGLHTPPGGLLEVYCRRIRTSVAGSTRPQKANKKLASPPQIREWSSKIPILCNCVIHIRLGNLRGRAFFLRFPCIFFVF